MALPVPLPPPPPVVVLAAPPCGTVPPFVCPVLAGVVHPEIKIPATNRRTNSLLMGLESVLRFIRVMRFHLHFYFLLAYSC